jgi:hypothetical protein
MYGSKLGTKRLILCPIQLFCLARRINYILLVSLTHLWVELAGMMSSYLLPLHFVVCAISAYRISPLLGAPTKP